MTKREVKWRATESDVAHSSPTASAQTTSLCSATIAGSVTPPHPTSSRPAASLATHRRAQDARRSHLLPLSGACDPGTLSCSSGIHRLFGPRTCPRIGWPAASEAAELETGRPGTTTPASPPGMKPRFGRTTTLVISRRRAARRRFAKLAA